MITLFERTEYSISKGPLNQDKTNICFPEDVIFELFEINKTKSIFSWKENSKLNFKIIPKDYVGIIQLGDVSIELLPKFTKDIDYTKVDRKKIFNTLVRMFHYSEYLSSFPSAIHSKDTLDDKFEFVDIFLYIFSKNLLELLKVKRNKEYVCKFRELKFLREKIDFRKMWNPTQLHTIPCIFHDFTENNLILITLKSCSKLMLNKTKFESSKKNLRNIITLLDNVEDIKVSLQFFDKIIYNRQNIVFKEYIEICKLFLSSESIKFRKSRSNCFSFLFKMDKVFESFIAGIIKEISNEYYPIYSVITQRKMSEIAQFKVDNELISKFPLFPDIVIKDRYSQKILSIIDTKYVFLKSSNSLKEIDRNIIYQITSYGAISTSTQLMLIFVGNETNNYFSGIINYRKNEPVSIVIESLNLYRDLLDENSWQEFKLDILQILFQVQNLGKTSLKTF